MEFTFEQAAFLIKKQTSVLIEVTDSVLSNLSEEEYNKIPLMCFLDNDIKFYKKVF